MWHALLISCHAHGLHHLGDAFVYVERVLPASGFQHELKIATHVAITQQLEVLEHYTQLASEALYLAALNVGHVSS